MASAEIRVEVVIASAARRVETRSLSLPAGSTVADALHSDPALAAAAGGDPAAFAIGCWGRACEPGRVLRDGDRVELTRPLRVDPKEARRLRHRRDGLNRPGRGARR